MMRGPVPGILLAAALSFASAAAAEAQEEGPPPLLEDTNAGPGLFHYQSLGLFPSLRSGFETHFPSDLPKGRAEIRLDESWVKNLSEQDLWRFDFELLRTNVLFSWGVSDHVRLEVGIESAERTGGTLDVVILGFHHLLNLPTGSRENFLRNDNRIELQPPGGGPPIVVDNNDPQPFDQSLLLTVQHTLTGGGDLLPAVSWSLSVRRELHTGDLRGDAPVALGGSVGFVKELDTVRFYLGGSFAWFGREDFFGLPLRTIEWSGTLGVEWNLVDDFSLMVQYVATSGGVDRMQDLSRPSHEVAGGFSWEIAEGVRLEFAVIENIINFDNSPDFGVHGGVTFRW